MQTLRQELVECTAQQLEQIFRLWGMSGPPGKGSKNRQDDLLKRVKDPLAAHFVWEYLSQIERQILYRLLGPSVRGGTRRDEILKKLQLPEKSFEAEVTTLKRYLLLWEDTVKMRSDRAFPRTSSSKSVSIEEVALLHPYMESVDALNTTGKEFFSPKSDRSQMTLAKILTSFYLGDLDELGRHYGLGHGSFYNRAGLGSMIEDELTLSDGAFDILQKLDPALRNLFKWLCERGGKVSMQEVRKHTGYDDTTLLTVLHTLEEYAIAFDTFSEQERVLFVPPDVYENLKKAATQSGPEAVSTGLVPLTSPPQTIHSGGPVVVYDLAVIIGAIYQQNIEPTQAGRVPKRLAAKIRPLLHGHPRVRYVGEEDEYMEMVFQAAQELGLVQLSQPSVRDIKPRYESASQLEQWSQLDTTEQTRRLLQWWAKSYSWMDVAGVNYTQWNPYSWNPIAARSSILEYLQQCAPGTWYSVASLLQTIWDKDPFVLRVSQYGNRPVDQRKTSGMRAKWNTSEGEVYTGLLASTLFELGIVELGYQQPGLPAVDKPTNPDAFMLTAVGAAALPSKATAIAKTSPPSQSEGGRSLIVQPNFELLLLQPDLPALYSVLPFAQVNQVDVVSRLTLTRHSVLRGAEAGKSVEEMIHILEERSQKGIPQNVGYTLRDWMRLYKDAKISQVILLEVSSEAVADEICASPKLQPFGLRRLASCVIVVRNDINLQELRRTLDKQGILVRFSGDIIGRPNRYMSTFGMLQ